MGSRIAAEQFAALEPACEFRSLLTFPVLLDVAKSGGYLPDERRAIESRADELRREWGIV